MLIKEPSINVNDNVTIKTIDGITGKVLDINTGHNIILNTGIDHIRHAITPIPYHPVAFLQLGGNATPETVNDAPTTSDGQLSIGPSEIFDVRSFFITPEQTLFKCIVNIGEGNGTGIAYYNEAVLMYLTSTSPSNVYAWFARYTFNNKVKNSSLLFEINWQVNFKYISA